MRKIEWKIVINDNNQIISMEHATCLPQQELESHLIIIGVLENLKQKHLNKLNTLFEKTIKKGDETKNDL